MTAVPPNDPDGQVTGYTVRFNPSKEMTAVPPEKAPADLDTEQTFQPLKGNDGRAAKFYSLYELSLPIVSTPQRK